MGASLRALFELPIDYEGRDEADGDEKLVARYAEGATHFSFLY